jgi:hypothetical protein
MEHETVYWDVQLSVTASPDKIEIAPELLFANNMALGTGLAVGTGVLCVTVVPAIFSVRPHPERINTAALITTQAFKKRAQLVIIFMIFSFFSEGGVQVITVKCKRGTKPFVAKTTGQNSVF